MIVLDPSILLADALSRWGLRELKKPQYATIPIPSDDRERTALGIDAVMRHVSDLIARILLAEPVDPVETVAFRAHVERQDAPNLVLCHGMSLAEWPSNDHVRHLIENPSDAPIVATVRVGPNPGELVGPIIIYDGFHRAKAWLLTGCARPLVAEVIKTKRRPFMQVKIGDRLIVDIEEG